MSYLQKDNDGRWELLPEGFTLHCGDTVELQEEDGVWSRFRIEASKGKYYAVGFDHDLYNGIPARGPAHRSLIG